MKIYCNRKIVPLLPVKTVTGTWRWFIPIYEVLVFNYATTAHWSNAGHLAARAISYDRTIYCTPEDFLMLALETEAAEHRSIFAYKEVVDARRRKL